MKPVTACSMIPSSSAENAPVGKKNPALSRRDWIILPAIGFFTLVIIALIFFILGRRSVPTKEITDLVCMALVSDHAPARALPNTNCTRVHRDTPTTAYRFNSCGDRTDLPCGPAPAGTFRIVAMGSSMVEGAGVDVEKTFIGELPAGLSSATGRPVDVYGMGMLWGTPRNVNLRIDEVFRLKPDLVLWPVTDYDLDHVNLRVPEVPGQQAADEQRPPENSSGAHVTPPRGNGNGIIGTIERDWGLGFDSADNSRGVFALKHVLYQSQSMYLTQFLSPGNEKAGFLLKKTPASWEEHFQDFDFYVTRVAEKLSARGIPLVFVVLPHRTQADLVSTNAWAADVDPYALGARVKRIAEKHGASYIDILHYFRNVTDTDKLYYPVDGHMNATGHQILARALCQELTSAVPYPSRLSTSP